MEFIINYWAILLVALILVLLVILAYLIDKKNRKLKEVENYLVKDEKKIENNVDLISIDNEYNTEYRSSLYQAQTTNNLDTLVSVFEKCQFRLDIKLSDFFELIDQVSKEVNS